MPKVLKDGDGPKFSQLGTVLLFTKDSGLYEKEILEFARA